MPTVVGVYTPEYLGHYGANLAAIGVMLQARAEVVAERGEPRPDWPEKAREWFIDEVQRRTRVAMAELSRELAAPARPLAPEATSKPINLPVPSRPKSASIVARNGSVA